MSDINIKRHGAPIPFYGHQDGEIAVAVASSDSVNSPVHEGYVLVTTALGTLAKSSDCADPKKGENLCYIAALPVGKAIDLAEKLLGALSEAIDCSGGRSTIRQRLLAEAVPAGLRVELRDALTAAIDAPRLAARETAEVVAQDGTGDASVRLLRTPFEWGTSDEDGMSIWHTGPDAERAARADYADARNKALCICGAECDADEIDRSGDEPQCPKCVAAAVEAFKAQRFRCAQYDCNGSPCTGHKPCGWTGTGADLSAPSADFEPYECPKCGAFSVEEIRQ